MAKTDVTLQLKNAVVLGAGDKSKMHLSGSIVTVSEDLAAQLINARAAVVYQKPRVADSAPVPVEPVLMSPASVDLVPVDPAGQI
jgi:hypothetical protein